MNKNTVPQKFWNLINQRNLALLFILQQLLIDMIHIDSVTYSTYMNTSYLTVHIVYIMLNIMLCLNVCK